MWKLRTLRLAAPLVLAWLLSAPLAGLASAAVRAAELMAPQQVIEAGSDRLREVLHSDRDLLKRDPQYVHRIVNEKFLPHVDLDRAASLALGKHWREATPEQRAAFQSEFTRLLVRSYSSAIDELSEWEIRFEPLTLAPGQRDTVVRTEVMRRDGAPIPVDYSMSLNDGHWRVYDVKIDGISLISNYRSGFAQTIRSKGLDGLIAELSAKNAARPSAGS